MAKLTLADKLTKQGAQFDAVRRASKLPQFTYAEKPVTHVVRLSMVYKGQHKPLGLYDHLDCRRKLVAALKAIRGVTVLTDSFKEYHGRAGYWGGRGSYVPAAVTNWTISVYVNWKGD